MSFIIRGPVAPLRAFASGAFLLLACATLGGCNDIAANPPSADGQAQFVRRDDANMAAATVAIVSVDGAPADLSAHFNQSLETAAAARRIAVVDPAKARYLVRGYLTATPIEGGTEVDLVWDVFTPDKQRAQRLSDAIAVRGAGDDAWAMIGDAGLDSVAAKSRRRSRRLPLQHPRGGAGGRRAELRPVDVCLHPRPEAPRRGLEGRIQYARGRGAPWTMLRDAPSALLSMRARSGSSA